MAEKTGISTTALTQAKVEFGNRRDTSWTPTTTFMYCSLERQQPKGCRQHHGHQQQQAHSAAETQAIEGMSVTSRTPATAGP
jgi:hypothetical protein